MIHHASVVVKKKTPTTITNKPHGRKKAARSTRRLASGGSLSSAESNRSGSRIEPRVALRAVFEEGQAHPVARLQPEGSGGIALIHREAKASMGVRDEYEIPNLRMAEGLDVADRYFAALGGLDLELHADVEAGFFLRH